MTTAIVTGAAQGIGKAIADRLAHDGHDLILVDLSPGLAEAAVELETITSVTSIQVDLTDPAGVGAVAEAASGGIDVLVNNAGITRDARLINLTPGDFDAVLAVNLGATYELTRALIPSMREGATIVSLASRAYLGNFGQYNYSMTKGAVVGMTRALAVELAPRIRVNAIAPGLIGTEMAMGIPEDIRTKMVSAIPLDRMGEPAEVAALVSFLSSAESSYITGQVVVIGGGRSFT